MTEYAVVLIWDTESDEGEVPVLVKIRATSAIAAIDKGIELANTGTLYCLVFGEPSEGGDEEFMLINKDKSFAVDIRGIVSVD